MKFLQERIAMDLVVLNIISILALMFFPMKTKGKKFLFFYYTSPQLNHVSRSILCSDSVHSIDNRFFNSAKVPQHPILHAGGVFLPLKISGGYFSPEIMQQNNCVILQVCVSQVMKHFGKLRKTSRTKSCICIHLEELLRSFRALQISRVSISAC